MIIRRDPLLKSKQKHEEIIEEKEF